MLLLQARYLIGENMENTEGIYETFDFESNENSEVGWFGGGLSRRIPRRTSRRGDAE